MTNTAQIKEHMKVVGSDGQHVGTVDRVQGNQIILTKSDPMSGGHHHSIPLSMVEGVQHDTLRLNLTAAQAQQKWQVADDQSQADGTSKARGSSR